MKKACNGRPCARTLGLVRNVFSRDRNQRSVFLSSLEELLDELSDDLSKLLDLESESLVPEAVEAAPPTAS